MAKRKKRPEEPEGHLNHERWMLSYADMLTLLLALFIVMFAISKIDQKKFETFARGTAEGFGQANVAIVGETGNLDGTDGILEGQEPNLEKKVPSDLPALDSRMAQEALEREKAVQRKASSEKKTLQSIRDTIAKQLAAKGLKDAVQFQLDERGLVVNIITDKVLFDTGKAELRPAGSQVIDLIAPVVKPLPNRLTVEGHTDNVPISGTFRSNWELSQARAAQVLQRLLADGVPGGKMSVGGYGEQRPLADNATDAGRARNRRVAIVVLPTVPLSQPGTSTTVTSPVAGASAPVAK